MRLARNHSEMAGGGPGLNLRMTEVTAAILYQQLLKGPKIVAERIEIAEAMTDMVRDMPMLVPPTVRDGCTHSYYIWALKCTLNRKDLSPPCEQKACHWARLCKAALPSPRIQDERTSRLPYRRDDVEHRLDNIRKLRSVPDIEAIETICRGIQEGL